MAQIVIDYDPAHHGEDDARHFVENYLIKQLAPAFSERVHSVRKVAPSKDPYFRTSVVIEVLSRYEAWEGTPMDLGAQVEAGDVLAEVKYRTVEQVPEAVMADLIRAQGGEPWELIPDETTQLVRDVITGG